MPQKFLLQATLFALTKDIDGTTCKREDHTTNQSASRRSASRGLGFKVPKNSTQQLIHRNYLRSSGTTPLWLRCEPNFLKTHRDGTL